MFTTLFVCALMLPFPSGTAAEASSSDGSEFLAQEGRKRSDDVAVQEPAPSASLLPKAGASPDPNATLQPAADQEAGVGLLGTCDVVRVRVTWIYTDERGIVRPMNDVTIQVWNDEFGGWQELEGDELVAVGTTDITGTYLSPPIPNDDGQFQATLDVYVEARGATDPGIYLKTVGSTLPYRAFTQTRQDVNPVDTACIVEFGNWEPAETQLMAWRHYMASIWSWKWASGMAGDLMDQVKVYYPWNVQVGDYRSRSHYWKDSVLAGPGEVYLDPEDDGRYPNVTYHEHGHAVMDWAYGWEDFPESMYDPAVWDHAFCAADEPYVAYGEGWAEFWNAYVYVREREGTRVDGWDIETGKNANGTECTAEGGAHVEGHVARTFWDLHDASPDGLDEDGIGNGDPNAAQDGIWRVLRNGAHPQDFTQYRDQWRAMGFDMKKFHKASLQNHIVWPNEPPTVSVAAPVEGETVKEEVLIRGSADDVEDGVVAVEVRIDDGPWQTASGTTSWQYAWDTTAVANGPHAIHVRALDATATSEVATRGVTVSNRDALATNALATASFAMTYRNEPTGDGCALPQGSTQAPCMTDTPNSTFSDLFQTTYVFAEGGCGRVNGNNVAGEYVEWTFAAPRLVSGLNGRLLHQHTSGDGAMCANVVLYDARGQEVVEKRWGLGARGVVHVFDEPVDVIAAKARVYPIQTCCGGWNHLRVYNVEAYAEPGAQATRIQRPAEGATVGGVALVQGLAADNDGTVQRVEVRIDDGPWQVATGTDAWTFSWDTTAISTGAHVIRARSFDGQTWSSEATVGVTVERPPPTDGNLVSRAGTTVTGVNAGAPGPAAWDGDVGTSSTWRSVNYRPGVADCADTYASMEVRFHNFGEPVALPVSRAFIDGEMLLNSMFETLCVRVHGIRADGTEAPLGSFPNWYYDQGRSSDRHNFTLAWETGEYVGLRLYLTRNPSNWGGTADLGLYLWEMGVYFDPGAPGAPSLATTNVTSRVRLDWTPPASDGGSPIQEYRVYRDGALLATLPASNRSFEDWTTPAGATRAYVVAAHNAVGGTASAAEDGHAASPPARPVISVHYDVLRNVVSWSEPAHERPLDAYVLRGRAVGASTWHDVATLAPDATSHADSTDGHLTRCYVLVARSDGIESAPSAEVCPA